MPRVFINLDRDLLPKKNARSFPDLPRRQRTAFQFRRSAASILRTAASDQEKSANEFSYGRI
jgi:hypothetical protein